MSDPWDVPEADDRYGPREEGDPYFQVKVEGRMVRPESQGTLTPAEARMYAMLLLACADEAEGVTRRRPDLLARPLDN